MNMLQKDNVTGFYKKDIFFSKIKNLLKVQDGRNYIALSIHVKNLGTAIDAFGEEFGNKVVRCVASWIRQNFDSDCIFGRFSNDRFGVFTAKDLFDPFHLDAALSYFFVNDEENSYQVSIQTGAYKVERPFMDPVEMFDKASMAAAIVQDVYYKHISYYSSMAHDQFLFSQKLSSQLFDALYSDQVCPYLQPIADSTGKIVGAEALVRWMHPELGFLSPGDFVPIFEKNGMIIEMDKYIWNCVCKVLSRWKDDSIDMFISINISPDDFYYANVVDEIQKLSDTYGIDPKQLRVEITETTMSQSFSRNVGTLNTLRKRGFLVEMDDFGSGYSSLSLLKNMPVDILKIDMGFLRDANDVNRAMTVIKHVINMAKDLDIVPLVEGVEEEWQFKALAEMGCNLFQGYYFSKPIPVSEFEKRIEESRQKL